MKTSTAVPNFDRLASPYRWLEYLTFGPYLWRCRTCFLPQLLRHLPALRHALILGDGDGRFAARLLRASPQIHVSAVDASPRMIETLHHFAAPHTNRLTTQIADIRVWHLEPSSAYDLIVSHFFLDCLTIPEIDALAGRLSAAGEPGVLWLISEFAIPPTRFGRLIAAPLVASLYRAFQLLAGLRIQTLPDYAKSLSASGWTLKKQQTHLRGLLVSQLWQSHRQS